MDTKVCARCFEAKAIKFFGINKRKNGRFSVRKWCRPCRHIIEKERGSYNPEKDRAVSRERYDTKYKIERAANINRAKYILTDCRRDDKKRGHECDLTEEFILEQIVHPCSYCGAQGDDIKITLDRIDNSKGHLMSNVLTACLSCNISKRDKAFPKWITLCFERGYNVAQVALDRPEWITRSGDA